MLDTKAVACTMMVLAVVFSAVMSHYGWVKPPKPKAVGIDLGTTFSAVGIFNTGVGDVIIPAIYNTDTIIPSAIAYENGAFVVGKRAEELGALEAFEKRNFFYDMKRFIGKNLSAATEFYDSSRYPFVISTKNETGLSQFEFPLFAGDASIDKVVLAHDLSAQVLKYLKKEAEKVTGNSVDAAVVGVPVSFDESQRNGTIRAAKEAGLELLALANEPTLAAMAYGLHEQSDVKLVIVYDLGGGTLDVSLLEKQTDSMFYVLNSSGDTHFGGQDFNHLVYRSLIQTMSPEDAQNSRIQQQLRREIESAKQFLNSDLGDEDPQLIATLGALTDHSGQPLTLSRARFDQLTQPLVDKAVAAIEDVLAEREISVDDIDRVVMVGGSSRLRSIRKAVSEKFNDMDLHTDVPPEHAVAIGAALLAARLTAQWPLPIIALD